MTSMHSISQALKMVYFTNKPYPAKGEDLPLPGKNLVTAGTTRKRIYEGDDLSKTLSKHRVYDAKTVSILDGSVKKRINF